MNPQKEPVQPVAAVLALVFPGAGHWFLGYKRRAVRIAAGVLLLFLTGLLIGGIDSVDRRENRVWFWFYGQMWNGPMVFLVDYVHQHHFKVVSPEGYLRAADPDERRDPATGRAVPVPPDPATGKPPVGSGRPPKVRSMGRISELGTLFIAISGMLNLICVIDAAFKERTRKET